MFLVYRQVIGLGEWGHQFEPSRAGESAAPPSGAAAQGFAQLSQRPEAGGLEEPATLGQSCGHAGETAGCWGPRAGGQDR